MKKKEINYQLLIRRICLIVLDIICIIAASILALLTRFEFDFSQIPKEFLKVIYKYGPFTIVITLIIFTLFRIYSSLWEYAGIEEVFSLIAACLAAAVAKLVIISFTWSVMPRSWYVLDTIYLMILIGATRVSYRLIRLRRQNRTFPWSKRKKVMIIGGGEAGRSLITEIQNSKYLDQKVVCIIDDDPYKIGRYIKGVKVVGNRNSIKKSVKKYNVQQIILTMPSANAAKIRPIVEICQDTNCELMILPGVYQLVNGEVKASKLRPVNIDDLLGRDEVHVNLNEVMDYVSGRVIMVTGGGGSIGSELCRQIAKHSPKQLIIFDIYENNAYDIQQELLREQPKLDLVVLIGSVRDENRINSIFEQYRPEIIYHAAAHKHVPLMEGSPNEAIKNNVLGTYNMVRMADKWNAKRFVQISTDKAVNPTNIMGASKRICEMIIQTYNKESDTEYVAVRFGNVLGSNGSVIPLFKKQIAEGGPVTVTHPEIIRYFMTIPEAVSLVLQAGAYAKGGEIFVLDMGEPVKILDLARNMIRLSGYKVDQDIKIEFTGLRPGEKLYEELLMDEEGMTDTPNKLIHIGHPIDVDEVKLAHALRVLESAVMVITNHSYMLWQFRRELIKKLMEDYDVIISTPFVGHEDDFKAMGCTMIETDVDRRGINPKTDMKLYLTYRRLLKEHHPDMVVTYSIKPNVYAGYACRQMRIPYCVNVQGLGTAFQKKGLREIVIRMYKIALKKAKTVYFENKGNARVFLQEQIIRREQMCLLKGAGVNLKYYTYQKYPENDKVHFLYLGRIMKEKGMDELFYAAKELQRKEVPFVLDLVGFFEDEYKEKIDKLVDAGIAVFHGFQEDPRPYYAMADCVVLPSYHEGMSNVLLEAAATGRPVITSNIPGCKEAVDDDKSGLLCEAEDWNDLYRKMSKIAQMSRIERETMGVCGRDKMAREFDKDKVVKKTIQGIERV